MNVRIGLDGLRITQGADQAPIAKPMHVVGRAAYEPAGRSPAMSSVNWSTLDVRRDLGSEALQRPVDTLAPIRQ
jgi:hypothetical protein